MATQQEVAIAKAKARARARLAAAGSAPQSEVTPTLEANPSAKVIQPKTTGERLMGIMEDLSGKARGVTQGMGQILSLGAMDEAQALAGAATGRESIEEGLARHRGAYQNADPTGRGIGEGLGALMTAPIGAGVGAAKYAPQAAKAMGLGGVLGFNMGEGSVEERLPSAAIGAGAGLAGDALGRGIARMVSPRSTPQVQTMRDLGVTPTPGQALGGIARSTEEKLTSVPLLGSAINAGERRARNEFVLGAVNRALAPIGRTLPKGTEPGRQAVDRAMGIFNEAYSKAIPTGTRVPYTPAMRTRMEGISANAADTLDDSGMRVIQGQIKKITQPGSSGGTEMTGQRAQQIISDLRKAGRRYNSSTTAAEKNIGDVLGQLEEAFQDQLEQNLTPENAALLNQTRTAYANWKRVERAASTLGAEEGVFTPAQLQNAVRAMDTSADKRAFASGKALMQDISEAGKSVLGSRVPDSGTAGRGLLAALAGGGGYAAATNPMLAAGVAGGISTSMLAYTPAGQRLLVSLISGRQGPIPKALSESIRAAAPALGVGGAAGAANALPGLQERLNGLAR